MATDPDTVDPRLIAYFEHAGDAGLDGAAGFSADMIAEVALPAGFSALSSAAAAPGDAPLPADIGAL